MGRPLLGSGNLTINHGRHRPPLQLVMPKVQKIAPCLWFDSEAEDAAKYYTSIFKNSKITEAAYYSDMGKEFHGKASGTVMTVAFELDGQQFTALNGGPIFKFNEAISFQVNCDTQEELDYFLSLIHI